MAAKEFDCPLAARKSMQLHAPAHVACCALLSKNKNILVVCSIDAFPLSWSSDGETVLAAMEDVFQKLTNTGGAVDGIVVKDIPYYQMAGKDGGFADKLEQVRLAHLLQYSE